MFSPRPVFSFYIPHTHDITPLSQEYTKYLKSSAILQWPNNEGLCTEYTGTIRFTYDEGVLEKHNLGIYENYSAVNKFGTILV